MRYWPVLISLTISFFNVDFVVIPFLRAHGINGATLILIAIPLATAELSYLYWFWGWLGRLLGSLQTIREDVQFSKEAVSADLAKNGFWKKAINYFAKKYKWVMNNDHRIIKWVKRGGHFSLILVGLNPEPASRLIGVIFCRSLNWKKGFYSLAIGNVLHVLYVVGGWDLIFRLFGK